MSRRDGTGPWGQGMMSGRGFGPCARGRAFGYGARCGFWGAGPVRRGGVYGQQMAPMGPMPREESLQEYKEFLKNELKWINEELDKD